LAEIRGIKAQLLVEAENMPNCQHPRENKPGLDVSGSSVTNNAALPMNASVDMGFYRLIYP
jgi:hypothetical protein